MQIGAQYVEDVQRFVELLVEVGVQPALLAEYFRHRVHFAGRQADEGVEGIVGAAIGADRPGRDGASIDHEPAIIGR
ncbi:hypothetical protein D3C85_1601040 [compost metagenome]